VVSWASRVDRLSDEALLAAVALGDADACTVFVRRFQRKVYGLAVTMLGDGSLAEDVAQQAFERAWRHAAAYDPRRGSVTTWLLTITRRLGIDALRAQRSQPVDPAALHGLLPAAPDRSPEAGAVLADEVARLRAGLADLPPEQRRAVVLATLGGRTAVEISEAEGIPVGTAKTRLRAGLRKLRAELAPDGADRG